MRVYADNAATTKMRPCALKAFTEALELSDKAARAAILGYYKRNSITYDDKLFAPASCVYCHGGE